jgi:nuclear pore complex protein Nup155
LIYHAADHRNPGDIEATWSNLLEVTHRNIVEQGDKAQIKPFEAIVTVVREVAQKVNLSDTVFPPAVVIPMLEKYAFEHQRDIAPATWVMDLFVDIGIAFETLLSVLEQMLYNDEAPFQNRNRRFIAKDMLYVIGKWYRHSVGSSQRIFSSDENSEAIVRTLQILCQNGLNQEEAAEAQDLIVRIQRTLRMV